MKTKNRLSDGKKQIYYARTYRHLKVAPLPYILFLMLLIVPAVVLLCLYYDELTYAMSDAAAWVMQRAGFSVTDIKAGVFLPQLGPVHYLSMPTVLPGTVFVLVNLVVMLGLMWLLLTGKRKTGPISIYLLIAIFIHVMACVFFLLGRELFPYTLTDFSDLYMKQQLGIWITFLVMIGLVMGLVRGGILLRILTVVGVMAYSLLFGFVRYVLFLAILSQFSVLYMPLMFFVLGPFFDFLYFVAIYAISTNRMIRMYDSKMKGDWSWA